MENLQWPFNVASITFGLYSNVILPKKEYFPFLWLFKITASAFQSVFDLGSEFKIPPKSFFLSISSTSPLGI